jgi:hypothetical protein
MTRTLLLDGWKGSHHRLERLRRAVGGSIWPYENSGHTSIVHLAEDLAAHLRTFDCPIQAVAYSMGGLVLREALRQQPDLPLERAVFLHTPHQGTWAAHCLTGAALQEMRPGSAFLHRLNQAPWTFPALNVWCPGDLVVIPGWNARWAKAADEVRYDLPAHIGPIYSHRLHWTIRAFLEEHHEQTRNLGNGAAWAAKDE